MENSRVPLVVHRELAGARSPLQMRVEPRVQQLQAGEPQGLMLGIRERRPQAELQGQTEERW